MFLTVRLWDLPSRACKQTLTGHGAEVAAAAVSPDGQFLVSTAWNSTVLVWRLPSGSKSQLLPGHRGKVTCVSISGNSKHFLTAASDDRIALADLPVTELRTMGPLSSNVTGIVSSPEGGKWILALDDGTILLFTDGTGEAKVLLEAVGRLSTDHPLTACVSLSTDCRRLLVGRAGSISLIQFS